MQRIRYLLPLEFHSRLLQHVRDGGTCQLVGGVCTCQLVGGVCTCQLVGGVCYVPVSLWEGYAMYLSASGRGMLCTCQLVGGVCYVPVS
jgi:hypothetical protein